MPSRPSIAASVMVAFIVAASPVPSAAARRYGPKGRPPLTDQRGVTCEHAAFGTCYYYAGAFQRTRSTGASMTFDVPTVTVAQVPDEISHSLFELALVDDPAENFSGQIVEIGAIVNSDDPEPALFVFSWIAGQPTCYDECGFQPKPGASIKPGDHLTPGSRVTMSFQRGADGWHAFVNGEDIGLYPDGEWAAVGGFAATTFVEWFGEVAENTDRPCSTMGNGRLGGTRGAAHARRLRVRPRGWRAAKASKLPDTLPQAYRLGAAKRASFTYGGPGACGAPQ